MKSHAVYLKILAYWLKERETTLSIEFLLLLCKMVFSSCFWAVAFGLMDKMRKLNYICTNNSSLFLKLQLLTCCAKSAGSIILERSWFENLNLCTQVFLPLGTPLGAPEDERVNNAPPSPPEELKHLSFHGSPFSLQKESLAEWFKA